MSLDAKLLEEENRIISESRKVYLRKGVAFREKFSSFLPVFRQLINYTPFSSGEILLAINAEGQHIYADSDIRDISHFQGLMPFGFNDPTAYDGSIFTLPNNKYKPMGSDHGIVIRTKKPLDIVWNDDIHERVRHPIENEADSPEKFPEKFSFQKRNGEIWEGSIFDFLEVYFRIEYPELYETHKNDKKNLHKLPQMVQLARGYHVPYFINDNNIDRIAFIYSFGLDQGIIPGKDPEIPNRYLTDSEKEIINSACQRFGEIVSIAINDAMLEDTNYKLKTSLSREQAALVELKATQAQLLETTHREASHHAHRDLIGSIAHRIRNSMSLATMNTQTMKRKFGDDLPAKAKEMLDQIGDSLKLTSENIEAFTTYEKIEQEITADTVSISKVLSSILGSFKVLLEEKEISVNVSCPKDLTIQANEKHIHLIFENLIKNSVEAMPDGGSIRVSVATKDEQIVFIYEDSGPGIPTEVLDKLGKRVVSSKPTTGLGIGVLSIFEVFKVYGGTITYANRPEGGIRVTGRLPLGRSARA